MTRVFFSIANSCHIHWFQCNMFLLIKEALYNDELMTNVFVTESRPFCLIDLSQICFHQLSHALPAIYGMTEWINLFRIEKVQPKQNKTNNKEMSWSNNWLSTKEAAHMITVQLKHNKLDRSFRWTIIHLQAQIELFICSKHHCQRHSRIVLFV